MKKTRRILTIASAAILAATSMAFFAGCESDEPEVTITYSFNGVDYEVDYILSRKGAPQTVRHFTELADAGYYNNTVIHDYVSDGTFLYGGGYTWDDTQSDFSKKLVERDYWAWIEENKPSLTESVWLKENGENKSLYTVYGEFKENGCNANSKKPAHNYTLTPGALVMYYTDKGEDTTRVTVSRSDGGEANDGQGTQEGNMYEQNSATSLFYTWTGKNTRGDLDEKYSVFGYMEDFSQIQALLDAVKEYEDEYLTGEDESFTETVTIDNVNQYDPIDLVRGSNVPAEYEVPTLPIIIKSVEVTKY